jgi:hypothetical protein
MKRSRDQFIYDMPGFDLLGESNVYKQFDTQEQMFQYADEYRGSDTLLLFMRQEPQWGNHKFVAATYRGFIRR